jgi:ribosomal protein L40E
MRKHLVRVRTRIVKWAHALNGPRMLVALLLIGSVIAGFSETVQSQTARTYTTSYTTTIDTMWTILTTLTVYTSGWIGVPPGWYPLSANRPPSLQVYIVTSTKTVRSQITTVIQAAVTEFLTGRSTTAVFTVESYSVGGITAVFIILALVAAVFLFMIGTWKKASLSAHALESMKSCTKCGYQLPSDAEYCSECGRKQT